MRMIDANALQDQYIAKMEEVVKSTTTPNISLEALSLLCGYALIMDAPTIYAEPVKHGRWIDTGSGQECSVCGEIQYGYDNGRHYCPNCGAEMDAQIGEDKSHPFAESVMMGMDEVEE